MSLSLVDLLMFPKRSLPVLLPLTLALAAGAPLAAQQLHCSDQPTEFSTPGNSKVVALDGSVLWLAVMLPSSGLHAIHVLEQDPVSRRWSEVQVLPHTFPVIANQGRAFEIQGDVAIAGNPWLGSGGRARFYERGANGMWTLVDQVATPNPLGGYFGEAVALDGDLAVVSDPENALANPGQWVHVIERDASGDWSLLQTILRPASLPNSITFGTTIDLRGDWLAVGCPIEGTSQGWFATGSVFLYRRGANGLFALEQELKAEIPYDDDGFGYVQFDGDDLLVSARFMPGPFGPPATGRIYSFSRFGGPGPGPWVQVQSLGPQDLPPVTATVFYEFQVSGDRLVVGQPDHDEGGELNVGKFLVYERTGPGAPWVAHTTWSRGSVARDGEGLGHNFVLDGDQFLYSYFEQTPSGQWTGERPVHSLDLDPADRNADGIPDTCQLVGEGYCGPALANSIGRRSRLVGVGSPLAAAGGLDLCADGLPPNEFGYLMASSTQGLVSMPGASSGNLCLAGGPDFGRYASLLQFSGPSGTACTPVDWSTVPTALGATTLAAGDSWNFQFWFRDGSTSNFTQGLFIELQ